MSITIRAVTLRAFRAYPATKTFDFEKGSSLVLFGRNAHGKSSITDAFEFLLDEYGTLPRFGKKRGPTTSGPFPLRNIAATGSSSVAITYNDGMEDVPCIREVRESKSPIPEALMPLVKAAVVPFIVRGPELRAFIEQTPQRRYEEFARYLDASQLTALQRDVRTIQMRLGQEESRDLDDHKKCAQQLKAATGGVIATWDDGKVADWLSGLLQEAGLPRLTHATENDPAINELRLREANERSTTALETLRDIVHEVAAVMDDGRVAILSWRHDAATAKAAVATAATSIAEAPIAEVLDTAHSYFEDPAHSPDTCPVCESPFAGSPHRSRDGVRQHIEDVRQRLHAYTEARARADEASASLNDRIEGWRAKLAAAASACGISLERFESFVQAVGAAARDLGQADDVVAAAATLTNEIDAVMNTKTESSSGRYGTLLSRVNGVLILGARIAEINSRIGRRRRHLETISKVRRHIDARVHEFFRSTVSAIAKRTIEFFASVQRYAPVIADIKVVMVDEENENNRGIELLVDFDKEKDQKPNAYLSDSQQNTLALGLRLAIIRHFNVDLRFIVLDDVITSYDAEAKLATAQALVDQLKDIQLFVLTHDDMLWRQLRNYTRGDNWQYKRILRFTLKDGPEYMDETEDAEIIRARIAKGEDAAGLVRRYWERWLRETGAQVGARPRMTRPEDPFNHNANDVFTNIVKILDSHGLRERKKDDLSVTQALRSIASNELPNKAAHEAEPIDGAPSTGDLLALLDDYEKIVELVKCHSCPKGPKFQLVNEHVVCAHCGNRLRIPGPPVLEPPGATD